MSRVAGSAGWVTVLRRSAGRLVATLLLSSLAIFAALFLAPGDPATTIAGGARPDAANLARIRAEYHLDDPFWTQYVHWLQGLLTGDLGRSIVYRTSVSSLLGDRIISTALLVLYAGALIVILGVTLGTLASLRGGATRSAITVLTMVAMGAPSFVVAIVLITLFSSTLDWFPIFGSGSGLGGRLYHLTLPALSLSLSFVAYVATVTRSGVDEAKHAEHVDTARSRGLPRHLVVRRHVLRNASAPILTVSGLSVAGLFAGTAVAEQAFGVNGLGSLLVSAAAKQDLAVVQIVSLMMVTVFVVVNTVVDVTNHLLDGRAGGAST